MIGAALLLAVLVQLGAPATAVRLDLQDAAALPFTESMLEAAVETRQPIARGAGSAAAPAVVVRPTGDGGVAVETVSRQQQLALTGRTGPEAARLVALAVVDVLRPPTREAAHAAPAPVRRPEPATVVQASASPVPVAGASVSLLPGASFGFVGGAASFEPTLDGTWWRGVWGVTGQLAYSRGQARFGLYRFTLDTVPVRLGLRVRARWLDAAVGAVVRGYDTGGLEGGRGATAGGAGAGGRFSRSGRAVL